MESGKTRAGLLPTCWETTLSSSLARKRTKKKKQTPSLALIIGVDSSMLYLFNYAHESWSGTTNPMCTVIDAIKCPHL